MQTPEFQGIHLFDRLCWAKENIDPVQCDFRVIFEDPNDMDAPAKVLVPDPRTMTSLGLDEEDVRVFVQECLFPDID